VTDKDTEQELIKADDIKKAQYKEQVNY